MSDFFDMTPEEIAKQRRYYRDLYFADSTAYAAHAATSGQTAFRSLFLANGGAVLALLTLIGNTNAAYEPRALFWSFIWFGVGLALALLAQLGHFRLQASNSTESFQLALAIEMEREAEKPDELRIGSKYWYTTMLTSAAASTALFITGSFVALDAIT